MIRFGFSLLMAVTIGCGAAAQTCVQPSEQDGFNVVALKSSLMVGALSCGQQTQYNTFMTRFQPEILAGQQAMDGYFSRAYGIYAQNQEDTYVTELANSQSESSINMGSGFCSANAALFDSVLALRTPADLQPFTDANSPAQPVAFTQCSVGAPAAPAVTVAAAPAQTVAEATENPAPAVAEPKHSGMERSGKWVFRNNVMFLVASNASTDSAPPPVPSLPGVDAQNLAAEIAPEASAQVANLPAVSSAQNNVAAASAALPNSLASVAASAPVANAASAVNQAAAHAAPVAKVLATPLAGSVSHAITAVGKAAGAAGKAVAPVVQKLVSTII